MRRATDNREKPAAAGSPRELALGVTGTKLLQILPREAEQEPEARHCCTSGGQNPETRSPRIKVEQERLQGAF